RIHEHPKRKVGVVVPGRAVDGPVGPQRLVGRQDLLDDQIKRPLRAGTQRLEIGLGIKEPVDMIDPKPIDLAVFDHAEDAGVDVVEDRTRLDAQTGKIIDVEEAAVVDLVLSHAKKGDAPELVADEPIKLAPVAVELLNSGFNLRAGAFIFVGERNEFALQRARSLRYLGAPLGQVEK